MTFRAGLPIRGALKLARNALGAFKRAIPHERVPFLSEHSEADNAGTPVEEMPVEGHAPNPVAEDAATETQAVSDQAVSDEEAAYDAEPGGGAG